MAAEVSSLVRVLTGYKDERHRTVGNESGSEKLTPLITRDLLSGYSKFTESQELDLDLHVPSGWEKRLDLKSGKMFIQRCNVQDLKNNQTNQTVPKLQDLNFPPSTNYSKFQLSNHLVDETSLDLKLVSSSSSSPSPSPRSNYQSVCTLDKVKSALERAERNPIRKRSSLWKSSPSPSYSSSSSSAAAVKEFQEEDNLKSFSSSSSAAPIAAGCPGCLSYVLVMKNNPTCPRCSSVVPLPAAKKPRIDLNISI